MKNDIKNVVNNLLKKGIVVDYKVYEDDNYITILKPTPYCVVSFMEEDMIGADNQAMYRFKSYTITAVATNDTFRYYNKKLKRYLDMFVGSSNYVQVNENKAYKKEVMDDIVTSTYLITLFEY